MTAVLGPPSSGLQMNEVDGGRNEEETVLLGDMLKGVI